MNIKKNITFIAIMLLIVFGISACTTSETRDYTRTYDLSLEVAGEGSIRDTGRNRFITSSSRTLTLDRNSIIEIEAEPGIDNDFLFWVGNFNEFPAEPTQRILMDNHKELISVFGNFDTLFMGGDISRAWNNSNVIGYWKAMISDKNLEEKGFGEGALELYVRETSGIQRKERYIFDEKVFADNTGEILFKRATDEDGNVDLANFEYIAAILRIEEANYLETDKNRLLFVYSDQRGIEILILPDEGTEYRSLFEDALKLYDVNNDDFKNEINRIIFEYKNKEEYLIGNTFDINDPY